MTQKKLSEQELIQLLHIVAENRVDDEASSVISCLLLTTTNLLIYSMDEAFWLIELAKRLVRNNDIRGVQLIQKMYVDRILFNFYARQTPGTSVLGNEMREILGYYGNMETLTWLLQVDEQIGTSNLYPYPSGSLKAEMNRIASRLGVDDDKRIAKNELKNLLSAVQDDKVNEQQENLLSKLVSSAYNFADFVIDTEGWILLDIAEALEKKGDSRGTVLLRKICQDIIPGSLESGESLEYLIMAYRGI